MSGCTTVIIFICIHAVLHCRRIQCQQLQTGGEVCGLWLPCWVARTGSSNFMLAVLSSPNLAWQERARDTSCRGHVRLPTERRTWIVQRATRDRAMPHNRLHNDDYSHIPHSIWQTGSAEYTTISDVYSRWRKQNKSNTLHKDRPLSVSKLRVPVYGCESWTLRKSEETRPDAFEMKGLRKILWVSWTAKKNKWVSS